MTSQNKIYLYPKIILEQHLDFFGHVNNAVYLQLFEEARWAVLKQYNLGVEQIKHSGIGPIVLEAKIRFKRELRFGQNIIIETEFKSPSKLIYFASQRIKDERDIVCCEADFKFGLLDMKKRKLVPASFTWQEIFGEYQLPRPPKKYSPQQG